MGSKYFTFGNGFAEFVKRKTPPGVYVYNDTWVHNKDFNINLKDEYVQGLYKGSRLPFLIEHSKLWGICMFILLVIAICNLGYELLIPYFENTMDESTFEFKLIDDFIYYMQFVIPFILFVAYIISWFKARKIKYAWAVQTVKYYDELRKTDLESLRIALRHYEITCPHCGASNEGDLTVCEYCNSSMLID